MQFEKGTEMQELLSSFFFPLLNNLLILYFQGIFFPLYRFDDNEGIWDHHYLSADYIEIRWFILIAKT